LGNYYQTVFALVQHHKYSISDVEGLIPYERDLYFGMLIDLVEQEKQKQQ
tara:strand:- start:960 stop:1109 length:150 start_codon:yes stop_codon:yes gene_type:complete